MTSAPFHFYDNSTAAVLKGIRTILIASYGSKAWRAAVHGAAKNRHDYATEQQQIKITSAPAISKGI